MCQLYCTLSEKTTTIGTTTKKNSHKCFENRFDRACLQEIQRVRNITELEATELIQKVQALYREGKFANIINSGPHFPENIAVSCLALPLTRPLVSDCVPCEDNCLSETYYEVCTIYCAKSERKQSPLSTSVNQQYLDTSEITKSFELFTINSELQTEATLSFGARIIVVIVVLLIILLIILILVVGIALYRKCSTEIPIDYVQSTRPLPLRPSSSGTSGGVYISLLEMSPPQQQSVIAPPSLPVQPSQNTIATPMNSTEEIVPVHNLTDVAADPFLTPREDRTNNTVNERSMPINSPSLFDNLRSSHVNPLNPVEDFQNDNSPQS